MLSDFSFKQNFSSCAKNGLKESKSVDRKGLAQQARAAQALHI